jgi:hypothetical protein
MQHLDAANGIERHRDVQVEVPSLRIVHPHAVQQDQRLFEGGAADRQISLHAIRSTFLQIERRVETQHIRQCLEGMGLRLRIEHHNSAIGSGERKWIGTGSDDNGLGSRGPRCRSGLLRANR